LSACASVYEYQIVDVRVFVCGVSLVRITCLDGSGPQERHISLYLFAHPLHLRTYISTPYEKNHYRTEFSHFRVSQRTCNGTAPVPPSLRSRSHTLLGTFCSSSSTPPRLGPCTRARVSAGPPLRIYPVIILRAALCQHAVHTYTLQSQREREREIRFQVVHDGLLVAMLHERQHYGVRALAVQPDLACSTSISLSCTPASLKDGERYLRECGR
jgi:hypothetical protein